MGVVMKWKDEEEGKEDVISFPARRWFSFSFI